MQILSRLGAVLTLVMFLQSCKTVQSEFAAGGGSGGKYGPCDVIAEEAKRRKSILAEVARLAMNKEFEYAPGLVLGIATARTAEDAERYLAECGGEKAATVKFASADELMWTAKVFAETVPLAIKEDPEVARTLVKALAHDISSFTRHLVNEMVAEPQKVNAIMTSMAQAVQSLKNAPGGNAYAADLALLEGMVNATRMLTQNGDIANRNAVAQAAQLMQRTTQQVARFAGEDQGVAKYQAALGVNTLLFAVESKQEGAGLSLKSVADQATANTGATPDQSRLHAFSLVMEQIADDVKPETRGGFDRIYGAVLTASNTHQDLAERFSNAAEPSVRLAVAVESGERVRTQEMQKKSAAQKVAERARSANAPTKMKY